MTRKIPAGALFPPGIALSCERSFERCRCVGRKPSVAVRYDDIGNRLKASGSAPA